jgi:hypothetical protein
MVDDLDERLAGIRARGIEVGEIAEINERTRKAEIVDPDGTGSASARRARRAG